MSPILQIYRPQGVGGDMLPLSVVSGIYQWKLHVGHSVQTRQQVESLKDEAYFFVPYAGELGIGEFAYVDTIEKILAAGRDVQATQDI
jgi:hypothetical protein